MIRDQLGERILSLTGQPFQPGGRRGVEPPTLGAGQGLVRHLADQDVAKGEDIGPRGAKEVFIHQAVDDLVYPLQGRFERKQSRRSERASKH